MKKLIYSLVLLFVISEADCQAVGIGTLTPITSNRLEVLNPNTAYPNTAIQATLGGVPLTAVILPSAVYAQSNAGAGIIGVSSAHNAILGLANGLGFAGVAGSNNGSGGYGIWGNVSGSGIAGFFDGGGSGRGIEVKSSRKTASLSYTDSIGGSSSVLTYVNMPAGVRGEYRAGGNNDGSGILGVATDPLGTYGIGVMGTGSWYGVAALGKPGAGAALYAEANGASYALALNGALNLNGNFSGTGINTYTSDRILKKDINPISDALITIGLIKPSSYQFRTGEFGSMYLPEGKHYGVIAQDLQAILPELVVQQHFTPGGDKKEKGFNYLSVNYNELIPILIKGMQEQQEEISQLKENINKLEAKLVK